MTTDDSQWFQDGEFHTQLPKKLSEAVAKFYGKGLVGTEFAQGLATFIATDWTKTALVDSLSDVVEAKPMGFRVMRILEYTYATADRMMEDVPRWTSSGAWRDMTMKSAPIFPDRAMWEEPPTRVEQLPPKPMGKADWKYDAEFDWHVPCCSVVVVSGTTGSPSETFPGIKCGNGPLTGDQLSTGDCGEHESPSEERDA